jgi:hypothetical protein
MDTLRTLALVLVLLVAPLALGAIPLAVLRLLPVIHRRFGDGAVAHALDVLVRAAAALASAAVARAQRDAAAGVLLSPDELARLRDAVVESLRAQVPTQIDTLARHGGAGVEPGALIAAIAHDAVVRAAAPPAVAVAGPTTFCAP